MIAKTVIDKWRDLAPWPFDDQVEQDLVISIALIELFNNKDLKDKIAFRGGTAIHKLVFPEALRYSEDIDLNRLEKGPVKGIIDGVRVALKPMLGEPTKVKSTKNSVKILFDYESIEMEMRRLKVEINCRETLPERPLLQVPFSIDTEYYKGSTTILAFDHNEMVGTKIRALYQREKGRDLFDLFELRNVDSINWKEVVASFKKLNIGASAKNIQQNLELKMQNKEFLEDIDPLLPADHTYDPNDAHKWFLDTIIPLL